MAAAAILNMGKCQ